MNAEQVSQYATLDYTIGHHGGRGNQETEDPWPLPIAPSRVVCVDFAAAQKGSFCSNRFYLVHATQAIMPISIDEGHGPCLGLFK
jgi:hypothetical protein